MAVFVGKWSDPLATCWRSREGDGWEVRAAALCERLRSMLDDLRFIQGVTVVCELPQFFGGAFGRAVASRGDLVKLAALVGAFMGTTSAYERALWQAVPVRTWKGQLPKKVVENRVRKRLGAEACRDFKADAWDAVGLGLWVLGRM